MVQRRIDTQVTPAAAGIAGNFRRNEIPINADMFGGAEARAAADRANALRGVASDTAQIGQMAGDAGREAAAGLRNAASGLAAAGQWAEREIEQANVLNNETWATNRLTAFQSENNTATQEYLSQRGQSAVDGFNGYRDGILERERAALEDAPNPRARQMLERALMRARVEYLSTGGRHSTQQARAANLDAQDGQIAVSRDGFAGAMERGDRVEAERHLAAGIGALENKAGIEGWTPQTLVAQRAALVGQFYRPLMESMIATNRAEEANRLFEEVRPRMDIASQAAIQNRLENPLLTARGNDAANNIISNQSTQANRPLWMRVRGFESGEARSAPAAPGEDPALDESRRRLAAISRPNVREGAGSNATRTHDDAGRPLNPEQPGRPFDAGLPRANGRMPSFNGGDGVARNGGSSAAGPLQVTDAMWAEYKDRLRLTDADRNTEAAQVRIFEQYQRDIEGPITRITGAQPTDGQRYLAWFMGPAGVQAVLRGDRNANVAETLKAAGVPERLIQQMTTRNGSVLTAETTNGQLRDEFERRMPTPGRGGTPMVDRGAALRQAHETYRDDPRMRAVVVANLNQYFNIEDQARTTERARLGDQVEATYQQLTNGNQNVSIPTDRIHAAYAPPEAERIIDRLRTAQVGGQVANQTRYASPEQIEQIRQDLLNDNSALVSQIRAARGIVPRADGTLDPDQVAQDAQARTAIGQIVATRVEENRRQLAADPAMYSMGVASVGAAAQRYRDNPNETTFGEYAAETRAVQTRMGVKPQDQRLLTVSQIDSIGSTLRADPSGQNITSTLGRLREQFGPSFPAVFNDLVAAGRVPQEYQIMSVMRNPVGRADYQTMMIEAQAAGGLSNLFERIPPEARTTIRTAATSQLEPIMRTFQAQGNAAIGVQRMVETAVSNLTNFYVLRGMSPNEAAQSAADRIINDNFDIAGTIRVPKDQSGQSQLPRVLAARATVMRNLKPEDLIAPESRDPALSETFRREELWRNATGANQWVNNENGSGIFLQYRAPNGAMLPVMRQPPGGVGPAVRVELFYNRLPDDAPTLAPAERRDASRRGVTRIEGFDEEPVPNTAPNSPPATPNTPAAPPQDPAVPAPGATGRRGTLRPRNSVTPGRPNE